MDDNLDNLAFSSHPYDVSAVKLPFGGNFSDKLLADSWFNPSLHPSCYILTKDGSNYLCPRCFDLKV